MTNDNNHARTWRWLLVLWGMLIFPVFAGDMLSGSRPNIVFFLADDQSKFDHSAYGNEKVPTPTTDLFSKECLVFDRAFTGQAICAPSRSMLYSGLYPVRNGCFLNHTAIRPSVVTLPSYLKPLGYDVILAGKSHVKPYSQFPWSHVFKPVKKQGLPRPCIPIEKIDSYLAQSDKPFCMMVTSEYPHGPYFEQSPYSPDDVKLPPFSNDSEGHRNYTTRYYASIAEKEREFKVLLNLLERHGRAENTIVLYSDDHGAERGKFTVYDSGLNVAFMVRWPGKIKPGRTTALTSFADFVPTAIELAGGKVPEGLDGKSILPIIAGSSQEHHKYVYGVAHNQGIQERHVYPQRSVHDGRYHYIFNFNSLEGLPHKMEKGGVGGFFLGLGANKHPTSKEEELYDTQLDPHEMKNRATDPELSAIKARLKAELFRWMKSQNDYLSEKGDIPFLKVGMHELDEQAPKFKYRIPEKHVGTLEKKDPHEITAGKSNTSE